MLRLSMLRIMSFNRRQLKRLKLKMCSKVSLCYVQQQVGLMEISASSTCEFLNMLSGCLWNLGMRKKITLLGIRYFQK